MKTMRLKVLAQTTVLLLLSACIAQAASTITVIGRHPFHKPPLESTDDLNEMMRDKQADIEKGLKKAGYPELVEPLQEQFPSAEVEEIEYDQDTTFQWMFFKRNGKGKVKVAKDLTWGGKKALNGYEFSIDNDCTRYTFAVPLKCGNLALLKFETIENCGVVSCEDCFTTCAECQKSQNGCPDICSKCKDIEEDCCATCQEKCPAECKDNPDAPGCPEECSICPEECLPDPVPETVVDPCEDCPAGCPAACRENPEGKDCPTECKECPEECLPELPPVVTCDDCPAECEDNPYAKECPAACQELDCFDSRPLRFIGDIGYLRLSDPADFAFGRIGVEYKPYTYMDNAFKNVSFLAMVGAAPKVSGSDGADALLVDVFAQYNWSQGFDGFIGLGLGGWISDGDDDLDSEDTDIDILANIGARVYGDPDEFNISIFLEARNAVDELDSISQYGRFGIGLRFQL